MVNMSNRAATLKCICLSILVTGSLGTLCSGQEKMYWTDRSAASPCIQRANLNGSSVETLVSGLNDPRGIAVHPFREEIYWADADNGLIQCADLMGQGIQNVVTGLLDPRGIALDLEAAKVYWCEYDLNKIQRSNLDGSAIEDVVINLDGPDFVAVDPVGGKLYWTDPGTGMVQRANLNGSAVENLVPANQGKTLRGIAVDHDDGKIYWADRDVDRIQRAALTGSGVETIYTNGLDKPHGVALDLSRGHVYWTDTGTAKLQRSNLDGSAVQDLVSTNLVGPWSIALLLDDADGDRLPDKWEWQKFGSTTNTSGNAGEDWDGDGASDSNEFFTGTDPMDPNSKLALTVVNESSETDEFVVTWPGTTNRLYSLSHSPDPMGDFSQPTLVSNTPGKAAPMCYTDNVSGVESRVYKITVK